MYLIPLRLKHRNPNFRLLKREFDPRPEGTKVYMAGRFSSKSGNSGKAQKAKQGTGLRRRSYFVGL